MTDFDVPFGLPLSFTWNPVIHDEFIAGDESGWLEKLYAGHRDLKVPSSAPEGFDGLVVMPRLCDVPDSQLRRLVDTHLWALSKNLGSNWELFDATQGTRNRDHEFIGGFYVRDQQIEIMSVQLARRNYQSVRWDDGGIWREGEAFIDPLTALVAIYQLIRVRDTLAIPPLHIFTPGLLYQVKDNGGFNDVTRIDVEPPYTGPDGHPRPGLITLDWNWHNHNRARPNYNIGTLRPISF